jgi:hypothetical protein
LSKIEFLQAKVRGFWPHALQVGGFAQSLSILTQKEVIIFGYDIPHDSALSPLVSFQNVVPTIYQEIFQA